MRAPKKKQKEERGIRGKTSCGGRIRKEREKIVKKGQKSCCCCYRGGIKMRAYEREKYIYIGTIRQERRV